VSVADAKMLELQHIDLCVTVPTGLSVDQVLRQ
jgi:hypothetical protein